MSEKKTHVNTGIRKILEIPFVYDTFQNLHGGNKKREEFFKTYFRDDSIKAVLDIGCGTGILLDYLKEGVEYHGCDMEESYIEFARNKFGEKGHFYQEVVGEKVREEWIGHFDAINAHSLLHHLSDEDNEKLLAISYKYLKPGGFLMTHDPTFWKGQSAFSRWIVGKDRGQNIKTPEEYEAFALKYFKSVEGTLVKKHNKIHYSVYIMKMFK